MNIFKSIAKKSISFPTTTSFLWSPQAPVIREQDATQNSAVMACVFWAMRNVGRATFRVNKENHPLNQILAKPQSQISPTERTNLSGREFLSALTYSRILDGNAYALKIRNADGHLIGLDWIPHTCIKTIPTKNRPNLVDHYQITTPQGTKQVPREDILHDRDGLNPDFPTQGISRLKCVMRQIQTDNQIAAYSQSLLNNPIPSLIVSTKTEGTKLTQADADHVAAKMREATSRERAGGVIVPTFPAEITPIGFKPDDLAIAHLNRLPEERITAVLGIPAIVVGLGAGLERSTFSNMKEAREAAQEEFLIPLWQDLAQTFTDQLLPELSMEPTDKIEFYFEPNN
ncbi:MAG: phage portal protein [Fimbriimonadaceae bacterium]